MLISIPHSECKVYEIVKALEFLAAYLNIFSKQIKQFNCLRTSFEHAALYGEYEQAGRILDDIRNNYGISFWYIEARLLFLQISDHKDLYRRFYEEAKNKAKHEILYTYIRIIQRKVKLAVTNDEYEKFCNGQVKSLSEKNPLEKPMLSYIKFMANYYMDDMIQDNDMLQQLMIIFQNLSLVDQYILFTKLELNLRIQSPSIPYQKKESAAMLKAADDLKKTLGFLIYPDQNEFQWGDELSKEYIKKNIDVNFEQTEKRLFLDGKYNDCIKNCLASLKNKIQFKEMKLLAQAYAASNTILDNLPENVMLDKVVKLMFQMYVKNSDDLSQIKIWESLPRLFMSFSFGTELLEFVYIQLYATSEFDAEKCLRASLYSQDYILIDHLTLLKPDDRNSFLDVWKMINKECIICSWSDTIRQFFIEYSNIYWEVR